MVNLKGHEQEFRNATTTRGYGLWTDLFQETAFLHDVGDGLHLDAFGLVDVLEGVEFTALLVLDDSDLERRTVSEERRERESGKRTFPKAPLPTQRRRTKWNRLTSPSKSMGCRERRVGEQG